MYVIFSGWSVVLVYWDRPQSDDFRTLSEKAESLGNFSASFRRVPKNSEIGDRDGGGGNVRKLERA